MLIANSCRDAQELKRFVQGQLAGADAEALLLHVETCAPCADVVERLLEGDRLVIEVRRKASAPPLPQEAAIDEVIHRLCSERHVHLAFASAEQSRGGAPRPSAGATQSFETPRPGDVQASTPAPAQSRSPSATRTDAPRPSESPSTASGSPRLPRAIGRYQVVALVGEGGMGKVYKALDPTIKREVAVKVPRFPLSTNEPSEAMKRFLREVQAAAAVQHPHVCPIYDYGEFDGNPYVVMAYIKGKSLADHITKLAEQQKHCSLRQAVAIACKVAEALEAVHRHGVIHRDLKPGNILMNAEGRPFLTDFGLARMRDAEALTADGALVGTPAFMAPEQVEGPNERVGPHSDQYSLGVVLYVLVTGRLPFEGTVVQLLKKIGSEPVPPPSQFRPGLSAALEKILLKALAIKPEDRYASVRDFRKALEAWARQRGNVTVDAPPQQLTAAAPVSPPVAPSTMAPMVQHDEPALEAPSVFVAPTRLRAKSQPRRAWGWPVAAALLLGVTAVMVAGIIIIITDKEGRQTKINVPDNVKNIEITKDDKPVASVPFPDASTKPPPSQPKQPEIGPKPGLPEPRSSPGKLVPEQKPGGPLSPLALVQQPPILPGVKSWTIETRRPRGALWALTMSPDGKLAATSGRDGTIRFWNPATASLVKAFVVNTDNLTGFACLAWSPDGATLAALDNEDMVWLVNAATGQVDEGPFKCQIGERWYRTRAGVLAWSPDRKLAVGEANRVRVWDADKKVVVKEVPDLRARNNLVAWSPDGKQLAVTTRNGDVQLFDTPSWKPGLNLEIGSSKVNTLAWSPDSRVLGVGCDDAKSGLWEVATRKRLHSFDDGLVLMVWSPSGEKVAYCRGDGDVRILHVASARSRPLPPPARNPHLEVIAWPPSDDAFLIHAFTRANYFNHAVGDLRFWDVPTGRLIGEAEGFPETDQSRSNVPLDIEGKYLAVSPQGHFRCSPGFEGELIYIVQTDRGQETLSPEEFAKRYGWKNDPQKVPADKK